MNHVAYRPRVQRPRQVLPERHSQPQPSSAQPIVQSAVMYNLVPAEWVQSHTTTTTTHGNGTTNRHSFKKSRTYQNACPRQAV